MSESILPFVEGHGEVEAAPLLLRRMLAHLEHPEIQIAFPYRVSRYGIVRDGELERAVNLGTRKRISVRAILVLLDADDEAEPLALEAELLRRCRSATTLPAAVVLASREFESWFLGCKDALRGICGIRADAEAPPDPERIRDAKGRLSGNMPGRRQGYSAVADQPSLAQQMDIELTLERCPSFRRLESELRRLLAEMVANARQL